MLSEASSPQRQTGKGLLRLRRRARAGSAEGEAGGLGDVGVREAQRRETEQASVDGNVRWKVSKGRGSAGTPRKDGNILEGRGGMGRQLCVAEMGVMDVGETGWSA